MKHEIFNEMVEAINNEIKFGVWEFSNNGSSEFYNRIHSRICGMIEMLRIATDENYYFDENGLHYGNGEIVKPLEPETKAQESKIGLYSVRTMRRNARKNSRNPYDRKGVVWANSQAEAEERFISSFYNGKLPDNLFTNIHFWGNIIYTF